MNPKPHAPLLTLPVAPRDHTQGPTRAPVTLVEYGDYECPHCGRAYPIVKAIQEELGERLRFVFRNFPLSEMHPNAENAAEAAEAAADQGKFWEMHDAIFEHQRALEPPHLVALAAKLGLDSTQVASDLKSHTHAPRVREDFMSGVRSGVNGTPTFFLNGVRYDDSWDQETLQAALEAVIETTVE